MASVRSQIATVPIIAYTASNVFGLGELGGRAIGTFGDFMYFSVTSYTTLGVGDIVPVGALRVIAGAESLLGLLMITWSASFTFIYVERFWRLGHRTTPSKRMN